MNDTSQDFIPQGNPRLSYFACQAEIDAAVADALQNGRYILGPEVQRFEQEFAAFVGAPFGVAVASGTDAIELALRALGVGPGDGVLTVSHTAVATVSAIDRCGAVPIFVDIDPCSFTMDANRLSGTLHWLLDRRSSGQPRVKALIPVHLYGHPAQMGAILEIASRYELSVIEDCAQAHGAEIAGARVGSLGDAGAFSFYPTKNLGAFGDGGFVTVRDPSLYERMIALREYGWKQRYVSDLRGINTRLDEIQAAILRVKLRHLAEANQRRGAIAKRYTRAAGTELMTPPRVADAGYLHVFHLYVVRTPYRDHLNAYLLKRGIGTAVHYPLPVHLQPAYAHAQFHVDLGLEASENVCKEILSLPLYPELTEGQVDRICGALSDISRGDLLA
jgi:dTDP-4-amino-4,6-dideoxygalactose transaminase